MNDGEVTALAGSMALNDNAVLGVAMGSSLAAGFVTPQGNITILAQRTRLRAGGLPRRTRPPTNGPAIPASARNIFRSRPSAACSRPPASIFPPRCRCPVKLEQVQKLMAAGDERARKIYETIGVYFGYNIATYADFYEVRNLLVLGRVLTGEGGDLILSTATEVLRAEFPEVAERIRYHIPDEKEKRHGQAIAAASLPSIPTLETR